jgi:hypothetical protein
MVNKWLITIVIGLVALSLGLWAIVASQPIPGSNIKPGVVAGNTFTYDLKCYTAVGEDSVTLPPATVEYNNTEWYRVTVTSVAGPKVSFNTTWRFVNGTEINKSGYVNVSSGDDNLVFWAIYPANLTANQLVSPQGTDGNYVNDTVTRNYKSGNRATNLLTLQNEFPDTDNPSRVFDDYTYVYFDKATGMLVELKDMQVYNDPQAILTYDWTLIDSNVWTV